MDIKPVKTAVLAGGQGELLPRLLEELTADTAHTELVLVLVDTPDCAAAERTKREGAPLYCIERAMFPTQQSFDKALADKLDDLDIGLTVMAGWPYPLSGEILRRWEGQILCLYPSLRREEGAVLSVAACLLERDGAPGAVLAEKTVPLPPETNEETLAALVAETGGALLPAAAAMFCSGRLCIHGRQAKMLPEMEDK